MSARADLLEFAIVLHEERDPGTLHKAPFQTAKVALRLVRFARALHRNSEASCNGEDGADEAGERLAKRVRAFLESEGLAVVQMGGDPRGPALILATPRTKKTNDWCSTGWAVPHV
jgi:hypothetical protein